MKKTKLLVLSVALFSILGVGLASCGSTEPEVPGETVTNKLESIEITKNPTKMNYAIGEDFNPAGMEVTAHYADGTKKVVKEYHLAGNKNLQIGARVTVIYEEGIRKVTQLRVNVRHKDIVEYKFVAPAVNDYVVGEPFLPEGLKVIAVYDDKTTSEISNVKVLTEIVPENGEIELEVNGLKKVYKTNVKKGVTVQDLEVTGFQKEYFVGTDLSKETIVVTAKYSDKTSRVITKGYTLDKKVVGKDDTGVTVTYLTASKTISFKIKVDERTNYVIEGESAIISSSRDMRKTASGKDQNNANIGNSYNSSNARLDRKNFTGYGYLHNFACKDYTLKYKFNSTIAAPAKLLFRANGSGKMNEKFASASLNGNKFTISSSTINGGTTFSLSELGEVSLNKGLNELELKCSNSQFNIDQLIVKTASVVTPICEESHAALEWNVLKAPTASTEGKIYKLCTTCKKYEEVVIPKIGSAGLTAGTKVAATELTAAYTPYTYVKDGSTYKFNVVEGKATGTMNKKFYDFCSTEVETPLYQRYIGAMYLNEDGKAKITNGLPTQSKTNATDTINNNAVGPQSASNEVGTGKFKIKVNAEKAGSANIILRAASHKVISFYLNDCSTLIVNGVSYMYDNDFVKNNGTSFFLFEERTLANVNLKQGENLIEFELTAKFPNLDGIYVETTANIK